MGDKVKEKEREKRNGDLLKLKEFLVEPANSGIRQSQNRDRKYLFSYKGTIEFFPVLTPEQKGEYPL